jgi:hypothetical protein
MLIDVIAHFEHVQVIRCDIEPELVEKCRNVENEKKSEGYTIELMFRHRHVFLKNEEGIVYK